MATDSTADRGFVLVAVLLLLCLTFLLGALLLGLGSLEMLHSASECWGRKALYASDGGVEYTKVRLLNDWIDSRSWHDGMIDGLEAPVYQDWWEELVGWTPLRNERYRILYRHLPDDGCQIAVRAEGAAGGGKSERCVEAVFRPSGGPGALTLYRCASGPLGIQGTCWIWGSGETGCALQLGEAGMRNYYCNVPAPLAQHLPPCPEVYCDGQLLKSLGSGLWVASGDVISDGGSLGQPDQPGNDTAELLRCVVTAGALPTETYAVTRRLPPVPWPTFPALGAPFPCGQEWGSYRDFYQRGGEAPVWPGDLSLVPPLRDGAFGSEWGDSLVWWTESNHVMLYASGNIEVAGSLLLGSPGHDVRYMGTGHIHCGGDIEIAGDVLPVGALGIEDLLGISTDGDVWIPPQGTWRQVAIFAHADGLLMADSELHFAGCLTALEVVASETVVFYEVPAVSRQVCCAPDRWVVSYGNRRREAYWGAE
jgi:hypothetical protein